MNLKNRITAIVTAAAIAIPALAVAKYAKDGSDSVVKISGSAAKGAVPFTAKGESGAISMTSVDGGDTVIKIDGWMLSTGTTFEERNTHMKEQVFGWDSKKKKEEQKSDKRYVEVIVPTDKIKAALVKGEIDGIVKTSLNGNGEPIKIKEFKMDGTKVHGEFSTTLKDLGYKKDICRIVNETFDVKVCVAQKLDVVADISVKKL